MIWVAASVVLRWVLGESVGPGRPRSTGPLAAPIVVLIWLYFLAIAVLIGAALNAATRQLWPRRGPAAAPRSATGGGMDVRSPRLDSAAGPDRDQPPATGARPLTPLPPAVLGRAERRPRTPRPSVAANQAGPTPRSR